MGQFLSVFFVACFSLRYFSTLVNALHIKIDFIYFMCVLKFFNFNFVYSITVKLLCIHPLCVLKTFKESTFFKSMY